MANKINVKQILQLHEANMSRNMIANSRQYSRDSVSEVIKIAGEMGIRFCDIQNKSDDEVYKMFFPGRNLLEEIFEPVDYDFVHSELRKSGVTLKLLWSEYVDNCNKLQKTPMGYTKYCRGYNSFRTKNSLTNHLEHKPGIVCEVVWSGPTMFYIDPETQNMIKAYLFVATLPYSQYSYVEACRDMKQDT